MKIVGSRVGARASRLLIVNTKGDMVNNHQSGLRKMSNFVSEYNYGTVTQGEIKEVDKEHVD